MQDRTYSDLLDTIQGLCGVTFATIELPRITAMVNRRAKKAAQISPYWPRLLVLGEERTVDYTDPDVAVVPFEESGLDDIGNFLRVHRTKPFINAQAQDFDFMATALGATLTSGSLAPITVFVTYQKAYTPAYTSASTDVPGEWFQYLAHGTYADFLRSDGQQEKAALADAESSEILTDELMSDNIQRTIQMISTRISTNSNMQTRWT